MAEIQTDFYKKKKATGLYASIFCLMLVVGATGGLWFYNGKLETEIQDTGSQISSRDASISELRANPNIETYSIYERNAQTFETIQNQSQIPLFLSHIKKHLQRFGLEMGDIKYHAGELEIHVRSETNQNGYAYQKILQFMKAYRKDEKALFHFNNITEIRGYDRMSYNAKFTLK